MQNFVKNYINALKSDKRRRRRTYLILGLMSVVVAAAVFWQLSVPAVTMTDGAFCQYEEHRHELSCYGCGIDENHVHSQFCYSCGNDDPAHVHTDECYVCANTDKGHVHDYTCLPLVCDQVEHTHTQECISCGKVEHVHTAECYIEPQTAAKSQSVQSAADGELDADIAYVSSLDTSNVKSGTAPFDTGKDAGTHEAGKDYSEDDNIVRSFDVIGYDLKVTTAIDTSYDYRSKYRLMIQAVAELDRTDKKTPVDFDAKSFNNLTNYTQQTVTIGNKTYVIFLGTIDVATSASGMIPGTINFSPKLNVNAMNDSDSIKTRFYAWLDYNKSAYQPDGGKYADNFWDGKALVPDPVLSTENHSVAASAESGFTVSAAPNLNIQLQINRYCNAFADVDLTNHPDRAAIEATNGPVSGNKVYARVLGFGVTLQLYNNTAQNGGDNDDRGMKGIQIPDGDITFKLSLTGQKDGSDVVAQPFMYDYIEGRDANSGTNGKYGLNMNLDGQSKTYTPAYCAPLNSIGNKSSTLYDEDACYDGGGWTITPLTDAEGKLTGELLVTVSNYEISSKKVENDLGGGKSEFRYQFPKKNCSGSGNYSDIIGCFSSCYVQVAMPLESSETVHTYILTVKDYALSATSNGQRIEQTETDNPQRVTTDDIVSRDTTNGGEPGTKSITHYISPYCRLRNGWTPDQNNTEYGRNISSSGGGPYSYAVGANGTGMNATDGWVPLSYDAAMYTCLRQSGTTLKDKQITAVNAFLKFDAEGCEPVDISKDIVNISAVTAGNNPQIIMKSELSRKIDAISWDLNNHYKDVIWTGFYPWIKTGADPRGNNFSAKLYYVAKSDGSNWTSDEEMSQTAFRTSDLLFFKSVSELKASGRVCVGVYMEIRGDAETITPIFSGGDTTLYMGFHAKTTADVQKVGDVYDMTSEVVYWEYDSVCAAGGIGFSRDVPSGTGLRYSEIEIDGQSYIDDAKSFKPDYERVSYPSPNEIKSNNISGSSSNGCSYLIVGNVSTVNKRSSDLTSDKSRILSVDEKRTVTYTIGGSVDIANGTAADLNGMALTITDTLDAKTYIEPGTEISVNLKASDGEELGSATLRLRGGGLSSDIVNAEGKTIGHLTLSKEGNTYTYRFTNLQGKSLSGFDIYIIYQAFVGEIGGDDATEVKNNDKITSTATIRCDGDVRILNPNYSNMSTDTFTVSKLKATGLFKQVDTKRVETNSDISYTVKYLKSDLSKLENLCILDVLPYNDDTMGSRFSGDYALSALTLSGDYSGTPEVWLALGQRGELDTDCTVSDVVCSAGVPTSISGHAVTFCQCTVNSDGTVTIPDDIDKTKIVAVFLNGALPEGEKQLALKLTITPSGNKAGDYYYNRATSSDGLPQAGKTPVIAPKVVASVIQRDLSGMAWADLDNDGVREAGENGVSGIVVGLYKLDDETKKYIHYSDGSHIDCLGRTITDQTTGEDGMYYFEALPAGRYEVVFSKLTDYGVSPKDAGTDDSLDSDATAYYSPQKGSWTTPQTCTGAQIENIVLKSLDEFSANDYIEQSLYNDIGLVKFSVSALKLDLYNDGKLEGAAFEIKKIDNRDNRNKIETVAYWKTADWTKAEEMVPTTDSENYPELSDVNGIAQWYGLSPGKYTISEKTPPDGYYKSKFNATLVINADGTYLLAASDAVIDKNKIENTNGTLKNTAVVSFSVYNDRGYELPESGGMGVYPFVIGGLLLMAAPMIYIYVRRKERRSEN